MDVEETGIIYMKTKCKTEKMLCLYWKISYKNYLYLSTENVVAGALSRPILNQLSDNHSIHSTHCNDTITLDAGL